MGVVKNRWVWLVLKWAWLMRKWAWSAQKFSELKHVGGCPYLSFAKVSTYALLAHMHANVLAVISHAHIMAILGGKMNGRFVLQNHGVASSVAKRCI